MGIFGKSKAKGDDKFDLKHDPDSLSFFYMDTMLCNQYYL